MININKKSRALLSPLLFIAGIALSGLCPICLPAQAQGGDAIENSFPSSSTSTSSAAPAPTAQLVSPPLASPLSGSVRVIDQYAKPMRLKRVDSGPAVSDFSSPSTQNSQNAGLAASSSPAAPAFSSQSGSISDSGLQALFPSKDSFNPPPALSGSASADSVKAKKKHVYIWNMSLAGGYYDVTNTFQGVVPGNKLYLYGGFMADGHTPVPSGPVEMNHGGHIRWTPTMGAPPED